MANLYQAAGVKSKKDWHLTYTGVPVLMYDKGSAKSRCAPRVTFVLAERGTCFALWKDTIDNLSSYKVSGKAFHTMCLSTGESWSLLFPVVFIFTAAQNSSSGSKKRNCFSQHSENFLCEKFPHNSQFSHTVIFQLYLIPPDHSRVIGFSFDSNEAAMEFWENVERLTSNPENISLSAPGRKRKSMKNKRVKAKPLPPKSQISLPCQFAHVTNVTMGDAPRYHSLRLFVNSSRIVEEEI